MDTHLLSFKHFIHPHFHSHPQHLYYSILPALLSFFQDPVHFSSRTTYKQEQQHDTTVVYGAPLFLTLQSSPEV